MVVDIDFIPSDGFHQFLSTRHDDILHRALSVSVFCPPCHAPNVRQLVTAPFLLDLFLIFLFSPPSFEYLFTARPG